MDMKMNKAEKTRNYIIEKAAPIFNKYGYRGTTMSQLTRAINMTKGAIYGNFKDKDEIALAVFDYNFAEVSKKIERAVLSEEDSCDRLIVFARSYLEEFSEISQRGGCPILNAAVDSDDAHQPLREKVAATIETWMGNVSRIVTRGIKRGEIKGDTDPEKFASLFVSLIEGGIMLSKITGDTIHLRRNVDHLVNMVNYELRK